MSDYTKLARELLRLRDGWNDEREQDIACALERVALKAQIQVWKNLPWITGHNAHKTSTELAKRNLTALRVRLASLDREEVYQKQRFKDAGMA